MGQVSILEDIQEAIENLQAEIARIPPPTEMAVKAQTKRIEREQERLRKTAAQLLALTRALEGNLDSASMKKVAEILSMQVDITKRESLKKEILGLEETLSSRKAANIRIKNLEYHNFLLIKAIHDLLPALATKEREAVLKEVNQNDIDQRIGDIVGGHAITAKLRAQLKKVNVDLQDAIAREAVLKRKVADLQELLSNRAPKKR